MTASKLCSNYPWIILLVGTLNLDSVYGTKRQISCSVHSACNGSESEPLNLVHVVAVGDQDTVHYLWSSYELPSVVVARTTNETIVNIDLEKLNNFESGALEFTEDPLVLVGLTIKELWQMTYSSATSDVDDYSSITPVGLQYFNWNSITNKTLICSELSAFVNLNSFGDNEVFSRNGTFGIQLSVEGKEVSSADFPHLIYNANSTEVKVIMDNLYSNSSRTRYGLEMMFFSSESQPCRNTECDPIKSRSLSDEFSPGMFYNIDVSPPCSKNDDENGTFLSWRPVAYSSKEPSVASSTDTKLSPQCPRASLASIRSIAELFFSESNNVSANTFNITFGTARAGFYPKTGYASWSLMIGTGVAVHNKFSVTAIIYISLGVGALTLFFLTGAIFLTVRWCRRKDDDLLLSENNVN